MPLFREAGLSIAYNADQQARETAGVCVDGEDIRAVIPLLEDWLKVRGGNPSS
ncbi:hypothetical protein [Streptomyces sp. NBC_01474]|uniref:hypothetical protein n=1 Tax=Streptomyces sp. NBC_01474 TaxID=2903880 RepID=UPI002DDC5238|nr:hypothetical protein [Streptomyces sp. NBC_01474]